MDTLLRFMFDRPVHNNNVQARRLEEFFQLMAVCNTVVVAKKPHHDKMNDTGQIENSTVECSIQINEVTDCDATNTFEENDPCPSMESVSSSLSSTTLIIPTILTSTPLVTQHINEAINLTPKRPGNLFSFPGNYYHKIFIKLSIGWK